MLNKKDHIAYCLATACIELMNQDKTIYTDDTKIIRDQFVTLLSMTKMYYQASIDKGTYNWYKKTINAFDQEIKVGDGWVPLLLCNEVMAAWLQDNSKHLKFWAKYDFSAVYDHLENIPEELEPKMYEKAQNVIFRITGKKYNREKASRLLKLKAIKLRLQHEAN